MKGDVTPDERDAVPGGGEGGGGEGEEGEIQIIRMQVLNYYYVVTMQCVQV